MKGQSRKKTTQPIGWKTPTIMAALVALIAVISLAGYGYSKFLTQKALTGNVTVTSNLAKSFTLKEHKVIQGTDGSYTQAETVTANEVQTVSYQLIPGVDLPKDPFLTIEEKTSIPAFLYVEVVDDKLPDGVSYTLADGWTKLTDIKGAKGGDVYVYSVKTVDGAKALVIDNTTCPAGPIYILKDNTVFVTTHKPLSGTDLKLDFYGYLLQNTSANNNSTEVFTDAVPQ